MRYVAAYMLAAIGGNKSPTEDDIKKIFGSVGIEHDQNVLKKLIAELSGKSIDDLIAAGRTRLATVPSGGGAAAPAAGAAAAPAEQAKGDSKKEEKKEEEEEEDEDMGFGLFD